MYKALQYGFFKSLTREYYTHPQQHLNFLLTRLNYLPGFVEAKSKSLISANDFSSHSVELIEMTLKEVFSSSHHHNALIALEKKQFTLHELLSADPKTRSDYLYQLKTSKTGEIPMLSELTKYQKDKMTFCTDSALANFTRPKF